MGTVPLVNYQTPSAPPADGYSTAPEIGWTTSGIPVSVTDGAPTSNLYPNLRKIIITLPLPLLFLNIAIVILF